MRAKRQRLRLSFWSVQTAGWLLFILAINLGQGLPGRQVIGYRITVSASEFFLTALIRSRYGRILAQNRGLPPLLVPALGLSASVGAGAVALGFLVNGFVAPGRLRFEVHDMIPQITAQTFVVLGWSGFYIAGKAFLKSESHERDLLAAQFMLRDAELKSLRHQLQPHFLFNTLNAVSTLIMDADNVRAGLMISNLAHILRSSIEASEEDETSLGAELELTRAYLDIESIRFGDRLSVSYNLDERALDVWVPRFLLQSLVENAVKHGIRHRENGGRIDIHLAALDHYIAIDVTNPLPEGEPPVELPTTGIGLQNLRSRLRALYGDDHICEVRRSEQFAVHVVIPMR